MTYRAKFNWPLVVGWLIVLVILSVAIFGKLIAPQDPMKNVFILRDFSGVWVKPPFAAFQVPGYWLGSDSQGRDYLSQLLWAVRPTILMVVTVATVRLLLGTLIGVASGWTNNQRSRWLETLISAALSVPVLIVALGVIAIVGIESGILAFVVGLSLTGWAETARLVREQTRGIKGQLYIEAAHALGQPDSQIIIRHVIRQIMPVLWMLFAFEISATLLTTATLGFLGYYLGGGVWFQVEDFVMQRIAGEPELGQMLAIAAEARDRPEAMFFAGSIVFIAVMGFNLLGEGLRIQLTHEQKTGRDGWFDRLVSWIDSNILVRGSDWAAANPGAVRGLAGFTTFLIIGGGLSWWLWQSNLFAPPPAQQAVAVAGANLWASERRDPQGSLSIEAAGPSQPSLLWKYEAPGSFTSGPVVSADGTLYVNGDGALYAFDPAGTLQWQTPLDPDPFGAPALDSTGTIYVVHEDASLSAFSPEGSLVWQLPSQQETNAISGPIVNPRTGLVFFAVEGSIWAVTHEGQLAFRAKIPYGYISPLPRLDPTGERLIFEDTFYNADTGEPLSEATFSPLDRYLVGANGKLYLQEETGVTEWQPKTDSVETPPPVVWNLSGFATGFPTDSGVTNDGFVWLAFNSGFQDTRIVWVDLKGNVLGTVILPQRESRIIGVDNNATLYICGQPRGLGASCAAYERGAEEPKWELVLAKTGGIPNGGALLPGRIYVTTQSGQLFALGD